MPPGRYFRMHLVGYFEGIDSERGLEWRCSDSLSLREFLRLESRDRVPDHSWLSRTRARLPHEVHTAIFDWVLALIAEVWVWLKGERIGVDASTMEANAAMRNIVRRDTGEGYRGMLARLAQESGIETPTAEDLARLAPQAQGQEALEPGLGLGATPRPRIAKMKDGTTHLCLQARARGGSGQPIAVVAAELHPADEGDTTTLEKTAGGGQGESRGGGRGTDGRRPGRMCDRQGLSLTVGLKAARRGPWKTRISIAQAERSCALARRRGGPPGSHQQRGPGCYRAWPRKPSSCAAEIVERSFAPRSIVRRHAPRSQSGPRGRRELVHKDTGSMSRLHDLSLVGSVPNFRRRHPPKAVGRINHLRLSTASSWSLFLVAQVGPSSLAGFTIDQPVGSRNLAVESKPFLIVAFFNGLHT